jgi:Mrp family chromosome partitioning ATPase
MTVPENIELDPAVSDAHQGRRYSTRAPAGHARARRANGTKAGDATSVASTDVLPAQVLDACSMAIRNMGHSSVSCLGVTSCRRQEGRSTIAAGIAITEAHEYQRRTVLVDLDLEHPSLADIFGLSAAPGVGELLREEAAVGSCLQIVDENLTVVTAGDTSFASSHFLRQATATQLLAVLGSRCDVVVADLPPLTPRSGAAQLADLCGAVAIVIRSGTVDRVEIEEAVACLTGPVYAVVNDLKPKTPKVLRRFLGLER